MGRARPDDSEGRTARVTTTRAADRDLEQIRSAIEGIRFGEVRVVIQDGVIVQIDRVEKQRLR